MATATRNLGDSAKAKSWLVRNEQGETFGPVDFETLKVWACDGRLAPTNEVSENGAEWKLATSYRGLAMDWVAEVTPGTFYGPIHQAAMEELVKDGSIAAHVPFFQRHGLVSQPSPVPADPQVEHLRQQLTAQGVRAKQQAEAHATELEQTRRQVASEVESSKRQAAEAEAQANALRSQAAAQAEQSKRQAVAAAVEIEKARRQAAEAEAQANALRQQAAAQAEQAQQQAAEAAAEFAKVRRQAADAEADANAARQLMAAQAEQARQQASATAAGLEKVRRQAADAETLAATVRQQMAAQAEQSRAAQQQRSERVGELERQLTQARQEQGAVASRLTELRAETEARAAAWTAKEQALEVERQALRSSIGLAQAETAKRAERVQHLEAALAEAGRAIQDGHAVETQVQVLRTELEALRSALAEERQRAQQAQTRLAALTEALEEARQNRSGETRQVTELQSELAQARQQAEGLRALFRQAEAVLGAQPAPAVVVETLEAEPLEPEARPPKRPKPEDKPAADAEVLPPERPKPKEKPPVTNYAGQAKPGLSLADLEQQARRELERLGAQGASFFKKKK